MTFDPILDPMLDPRPAFLKGVPFDRSPQEEAARRKVREIEEAKRTRQIVPRVPHPPFGTDGTPGQPPLKTYGLGQFLKMEFPTRAFVLDPILPAKGLVMLYAARGIGKTHVGLGIAYAAASGTAFLRWKAPKPRQVLYVDGEMPSAALQERLDAIMFGADKMPPEMGDWLRLLPMDAQDLGQSLNLARREDQERVEALLYGAELLILDNVSTLVNGGRENDAESWDGMQAWLLSLRRQGVSVLLIHHAGRGDNARGTSKREDVLDTVIHLRRPDDYEPEEGARFEVHLTKARGIFGDDALPFEARLETRDGRAVWTVRELRDVESEKVAELTAEKMSVRDIAEALGISKSKVNRIQTRLRKEGQI